MGYSPWDRKEPDMIERLTLSLLQGRGVHLGRTPISSGIFQE